MDMHGKMWSCKYHEEGYLEDTCLYEDDTYNFDDPDNSYYLWAALQRLQELYAKSGQCQEIMIQYKHEER